jgi:tRNA (guanine26-N2/guanine27-N2)-dimethyltransferase
MSFRRVLGLSSNYIAHPQKPPSELVVGQYCSSRLRLSPIQVVRRFLNTIDTMTADKIATGTVERDGKQWRTVQEGKATILVPQGEKIGEDKNEVQQVFYNPIQQFNRDLSVLAMKTYGEDVVRRKQEQLEAAARKFSKKRKRGDEDTGTETQVQDDALPSHDGLEQAPSSEPRKPTFRILDALSASGLRALRYAHELPFVTSVTANDLSTSAAEAVKVNVAHNGLGGKIEVTNDDALAHMYRLVADELSRKANRGRFKKSHKYDAIDLDPYGTGAPFIDAAVQALRDDGGLLCITCTDSAVWAGHSYTEKAFALYGGTSIKGTHAHEVGLRLILNAVATSAARYGLHIEPQLSLSIDFYTRCFVRITHSPGAVKFLGAKSMLLYTCDYGCGAYERQYMMRSKITPNKNGNGNFYKHVVAQAPTARENCAHCGFKTHLSGPMYGGKIHSPDFIRRLLEQIRKADPAVYKTLPRMEGMLRTALEECLPEPESENKVSPKDDESAAIDHYPFYIVPSRLAGSLSCVAPPDDMVRGALKYLGYKVTRSHCRPGSIKTDAPWETIWWIMTEWVRQKAPIKESKYKPSMPAWKILHDAGLFKTPEDRASPQDQTQPMSDQAMQGLEQMQTGISEAAPGDSVKLPDKEAEPAPQTEQELRQTLVFDDKLARLGRNPGEARLVRYQQNPEPNWGPLNRAKKN